MEKLRVGVDISKATFVTAVWRGKQATVLEALPNNATGFAALLEEVQGWQAAENVRGVHLILEPTGGYELALVVFAQAQGWEVSLPNPKQVRDWAKGSGRRAKTDRVDAQVLAQFGAEKQPKPQQPLANEVRELDNLLARRQDLEQMLRQEKNRLGELQARPGVPAPVIDSLQAVLAGLEKALHTLEEAIQAHLRQHAHLQRKVERLLALPGVGVKNVLPLLVILERWHTLTNGEGSAKGLTAYVGLDPQPYESGSSVHKRPSISHMGDKEVRRLLYMGVLGGVRGNNPLRTFYQRLVGRGKPKKLALVAASRKLLTWAWAVYASDTDWNPALFAA